MRPLTLTTFLSASLAIAALWGHHARAEAPTQPGAPDPVFPVDDADPEAHVPTQQEANKSPLQFGYFLMELTQRAAAARAQGDHARALKFYRAAVKAVPDGAAGYREVCREYQLLGERAQAYAACRTALGAQGVTTDDHVRFVKLVATRPEALDEGELEDAKASIDHLLTQPESAATAYQMECELATRSHDQAAFARCVPQLQRLQPDNPTSLFFAWTWAVQRGDRTEAEALVAAAERAGMSERAIQEMKDATARTKELALAGPGESFESRSFGFWLVLLSTVLVGTLLVLWLARRLPRRHQP